eukprot:101202_1
MLTMKILLIWVLVTICFASDVNDIEDFTLVLTLGQSNNVYQDLSNNINDQYIDIGQEAFNAIFHSSVYHIIRRECTSCSETTHQIIYYRRFTNLSTFDAYNTMILWTETSNVMGIDFQLYNTLQDALNRTNPWQFCNFDDFAHSVGAFRDCAPGNTAIGKQWTGNNVGSGARFSIYTPNSKPIIDYNFNTISGKVWINNGILPGHNIDLDIPSISIETKSDFKCSFNAICFNDPINSRCVRIDIDISPSSYNSLTMELYAYQLNIMNDKGWIMSQDKDGYDRSIMMHDYRYNPSGEIYGLAMAVGSEYVGHKPLDNNIWSHIIAVWDGISQKATFYVNNDSQITIDIKNDDGVTYFCVNNRPSRDHGWNGCLSKISIYATPLTDDEINELKENFNLFCPATNDSIRNLTLFPSSNPTLPTKDPTLFPTQQRCDFRLWDSTDAGDLADEFGYSYLDAINLANIDIKTQLYQQYNQQRGLYPMATFYSSCCLGLQNNNELAYEDSSQFIFVASLDETQTSRGSLCSGSFNVNKLYQLWRGPHPTTLIQSIDINIDIFDMGHACTAISQPNLVMNCNLTHFPPTLFPAINGFKFGFLTAPTVYAGSADVHTITVWWDDEYYQCQLTPYSTNTWYMCDIMSSNTIKCSYYSISSKYAIQISNPSANSIVVDSIKINNTQVKINSQKVGDDGYYHTYWDLIDPTNVPYPAVGIKTNDIPICIPVTIYISNHECNSQYKNLGTFSSVELCAAAVFFDSSCLENEFMWSQSYSTSSPSWGCRCCQVNTVYEFNSLWAVYKFTTLSPTSSPTLLRSSSPTSLPSNPTVDPTNDPTIEPSFFPSNDPTIEPTYYPSNNPSISPTNDPTLEPTYFPTKDPTIEPTMNPTMNPTINPSINPTSEPPYIPTINPTIIPTEYPTLAPTYQPTYNPTINPTIVPTNDPTFEPTYFPTIEPTMNPTANPTIDPIKYTTTVPIAYSSYTPIQLPTLAPTSAPTQTPTLPPTYPPIHQCPTIFVQVSNLPTTVDKDTFNGLYTLNQGQSMFGRPIWTAHNAQLLHDQVIQYDGAYWVINGVGSQQLFCASSSVYPPMSAIWTHSSISGNKNVYVYIRCIHSFSPTMAPTAMSTIWESTPKQDIFSSGVDA